VLLRRAVLEGIAAGRITLAFRRWRHPTVKAGGRLLTAVGVLSVESLDPIEPEAITEAEARAAGYDARAPLLRELAERPDGRIFRIALRYAGPDPRAALRARSQPEGEELEDLRQRLARFDRNSPRGPWTGAVLELIARHPGRRAAELAAELGLDTPAFKRDLRKLKALGLTESLAVGYRLSPRGEALLEAEAEADG